VESVLRDFKDEVPKNKMGCMGTDNGNESSLLRNIEKGLHESVNEMDTGE